MNYLHRRGFARAAAAMEAELAVKSGAAPASSLAAIPRPVNADEFANRNQPSKDPKNDSTLAAWRASIDSSAWQNGMSGLTHFVLGSLDIHRAELLPVLLPVLVHIYLDLVLAGSDALRSTADAILAQFGPDHEQSHPALMSTLRALRLPEHVTESEEATRWRQERYLLPLSERGWGLLQGWLQGGGLFESAAKGSAGASGSMDKGRDKVLAIINEHLKIDGEVSF